MPKNNKNSIEDLKEQYLKYRNVIEESKNNRQDDEIQIQTVDLTNVGTDSSTSEPIVTFTGISRALGSNEDRHRQEALQQTFEMLRTFREQGLSSNAFVGARSLISILDSNNQISETLENSLNNLETSARSILEQENSLSSIIDAHEEITEVVLNDTRIEINRMKSIISLLTGSTGKYVIAATAGSIIYILLKDRIPGRASSSDVVPSPSTSSESETLLTIDTKKLTIKDL
jgi:hypothetical protein